MKNLRILVSGSEKARNVGRGELHKRCAIVIVEHGFRRRVHTRESIDEIASGIRDADGIIVISGGKEFQPSAIEIHAVEMLVIWVLTGLVARCDEVHHAIFWVKRQDVIGHVWPGSNLIFELAS